MGKKKRKYDKGASVGFLMALPTVLGREYPKVCVNLQTDVR